MMGPWGVYKSETRGQLQLASGITPTIFPVHFYNFEGVLAILNNVVVGFIVPRDGSQFWAGEASERV
jgi:hypothetical protein